MTNADGATVYDIEGTFGEVVSELARRNRSPYQKLRLHVEVVEEIDPEETSGVAYFGAFASGKKNTSTDAKQILRNELGSPNSLLAPKTWVI